jgi:surface polysaccharide O-acyltransferase-like enzyme
MISGALFLTKKELSFESLYSRYIKRIVIAFLFWSTIYAILYSSHPFSVKEFIGNIAHGHYHLWFLFMICGLYIALPILRLIFANRTVLRYFLLVSFIVAFVIPFFFDLSHSFGFIENFIEKIEHGYNRMGLHLFFGFTSYFLLGGVLKSYEISPKWRGAVYVTGVFCGLLIVILTNLLHQHSDNGVNEVFYNYTGLLVYVMSISVFIYGKYSRWIEQLSKTMLTKISDLVFGVYLIHIIVLDNMMRIMSGIRVSAWIDIPLITICVFSISLGVVWLLRKYVPYTNYVL